MIGGDRSASDHINKLCGYVDLGDIIAMDFGSDEEVDHLVMVTSKSYSAFNTLLYYSGHTKDRLNANFNQIFAGDVKNQQATMTSFRIQEYLALRR